MILNGLSESLFYILDLDDIKEYVISPDQNDDWSVMCIPLFGDGKDYASRHQKILKENYNTLLNNLICFIILNFMVISLFTLSIYRSLNLKPYLNLIFFI